MKIINEKQILSSFFDVKSIEIEQNNSTFTRIFVDKIAGCGILLYDEDTAEVIFVKQLRAPLINKEKSPFTVEVPAGLLSPNEDPKECIIREVLEETGYKIENPILINAFYTSPGYSNEVIHLYFSKVVSGDLIGKGGGLESENENIEIIRIKKSELLHHLNSHLFNDAKTIIAIQWFLLHYNDLYL